MFIFKKNMAWHH